MVALLQYDVWCSCIALMEDWLLYTANMIHALWHVVALIQDCGNFDANTLDLTTVLHED